MPAVLASPHRFARRDWFASAAALAAGAALLSDVAAQENPPPTSPTAGPT